MPATIVHPVILNYAESGDLVTPLRRALTVCADWWESMAGLYVLPANVKMVPGPVPAIDLRSPNPWEDVRQHVLGRNLLGLPPDDAAAHCYLVLLRGWRDAYWIGWGGSQLAVVGDWAIDALLSSGTPEAIVDDYRADGVICHEAGHVLGMSHDFDTPANIMAYDWPLFPGVTLSPKSRQEALTAGAGALGCRL